MYQHQGPLLPIFTAILLSACSGNESSAQEAVRERLKDPESARFGEFYYNADLKRACLTVNAKNSMGGYTGDKQVRMTLTDEGWDWSDDREESQADCQEYWADNTDMPA